MVGKRFRLPGGRPGPRVDWGLGADIAVVLGVDLGFGRSSFVVSGARPSLEYFVDCAGLSDLYLL